MGAVIGEILPLAVGVAISPVPIIAAILMLLSPKARVTSVGFLLGWIAGIVVAVGLFTLLSAGAPRGGSGCLPPDPRRHPARPRTPAAGAGGRSVAQAPQAGQPAALPSWMKAIDTMSFGTALGLGFLLSAVNPKNLLLAAGAGVDIGGRGARRGGPRSS
ncbi:hypothetical protein CTI14_39490 [Methylobacterium radiotolerans]|nr:hypothetical protein CTI14_39490 [Methylobacterium radiotolerans]